MHPADISAALKRVGYTQKQVGDECGVGRGVANAVIRGVGRSRRVEEKISELTGIGLAELWPHWYGPDVPARVMVLGHSNVAAGRDLIGNQVREPAASYGDQAEERLLRLYRALEPAQRDELERIARKLIAGG